MVAAAGVAEAQSTGQRQGAPPVTTPPQSKAPSLKAGTAATPAPAEAPGLAGNAEAAASEAKERAARTALERRLAEMAAALASHAQGLTYVAIALIVATAALWVLSFLQARDLRAAVVAVQEASAAARKGVELMQRALVVTQRATVIAGEPKAVWLRDAGGRLVGCRLLVTWHNVGNTPTKEMIAAVAGQTAEKPPSQASALPDANVRRQPAIVGPNAVISSAYVICRSGSSPISCTAGPTTCSPAGPSTTTCSTARRGTGWSSATGWSSRATWRPTGWRPASISTAGTTGIATATVSRTASDPLGLTPWRKPRR
jgi:hypothetical protein